MNSVVSSLWSLVGFGQRRRLETAELALRAALAERDEELRQLNDALGHAKSFGGSATTFAANLSFAHNSPATSPGACPAPKQKDLNSPQDAPHRPRLRDRQGPT